MKKLRKLLQKVELLVLHCQMVASAKNLRDNVLRRHVTGCNRPATCLATFYYVKVAWKIASSNTKLYIGVPKLDCSFCFVYYKFNILLLIANTLGYFFWQFCIVVGRFP